METTPEVKAALEQMRTTIAESWKQQIALTDTENIAEFKKNFTENLTNQIAEIYKDRSEKLPFEVVVENDGADKYGRFNVSIKTEDPFLKTILENLPENPGPPQHDLDLITTCL